MQLNQMIYQMCHETLAMADITAIRKARGFTQNESASRSTFENAFHSSTGLEAVMATLTAAEAAALHLLKAQPEPVEINFFERLYGRQEDKHHWLTPTQMYRITLDLVKKQLVRKGVLVMFEQKNLPDSVQINRWRFTLPPSFARFLPPLVANPYTSSQPGSIKDRLWVQKVREALGEAPLSAQTARGAFQVSLEQGTLLVGRRPFQAALLREWQQAAWEADLPEDDSRYPASLAPVAAACAILSSLAPNQWLTAEQLAEPLKIFTFGKTQIAPQKICQSGWKWGCLARLSEDGETSYRLAAPDESPPPENFSNWLTGEAGGALRVDLNNISLAGFEQINTVACLSPQQDTFLAIPDPVKLGRTGPEVRQSMLVNWLRAQSPAFAQACALIEQRWGKVIIHHNLLVARVRDLSLRVQLERELKDQLIVLSTEFIAFPPALRPDVERILRKSGFVVKEVKA